MPVKRRASKRRLSPEAELEEWSGLFDCGHDYFGEVARLTGLTEPFRVWPPADQAAAEENWMAAAAEAWGRLGATFMQRWSENRRRYGNREMPWALEQFGEPPCR